MTGKVRVIPHAYAAGKWKRLIYGEANIKVDPNVSHLEVKLLLFATLEDMWTFRARLGLPRSRCRGWCGKWEGTCRRRGKIVPSVEARFCAFMCFAMTTITLEIIAHECMHAAFEYSRRDNNFPYPGRDREEERVCYPTGYLTSAVNEYLCRNGETRHLRDTKIVLDSRKKL